MSSCKVEGCWVMTSGIRWKKLTLAVVTGLALSALGIIANIGFGWTDLWPQVFLTFGSAISLGGVLFVLQRSWVQEVSEEVQQVSKETQSAIRGIEEQLESHKPVTFEELRNLVSENADNLSENHRHAITVLKNGVSFENLSSVLAIAQELNAIAPGFRGRTSNKLEGPRLTAWLCDTDDTGFPVETYIRLHVVPLYPSSASCEPVDWRPNDPLHKVIKDLTKSCQMTNLPSTPPDFDAAVGFERLIESLDIALSIRRGLSGPRLTGSVIEIIDETWVLSSVGLEARFRNVVHGFDQFVQYIYNIQNPMQIRPGKRLIEPKPPEYVPESYWAYLKNVLSTDLPDYPPDGVYPIRE